LGLFITFEGVEGSGKTTQAALLAGYLEGRGVDVTVLREPGGTALGERVRSILLNAGEEPITPVAELFLYEACRAQVVNDAIRPALAAGRTVVCDRFIDSTVAYQGYGRGLGAGDVGMVNSVATGGLVPDLTIIVDCDPASGLERAWGRINSAAPDTEREDRFECEEIEFHNKVREGYLGLARGEPARIRVVDGSGTVEEVSVLVRAAVDEFLARNPLNP
jgi:dTMP kinase